MSFSTVIAVGPGPKERQRLADVLATLAQFAGGDLREVILVDDGAALAAPEFDGPLRVRILPSPREGKGDSWRGGSITSIQFGFAAALANPDLEYVLKLDTDSLLIGPVAERIRAGFAAYPRAGLLGSCFSRNLQGEKVPPSTWAVNLAKWLSLVRLRRNPFPHVEGALWGRNRVIRQLTRQAVAKGWPLGHCAQGGGYAVNGRMLRVWEEAGWLGDPLLWRHTDLGEDIVSSLLCFAAGWEIHDYNAPGEPFGVQYMGLGFPVPELFEREYGVIHSVKSKCPAEELALRTELFARLGGATALRLA